MASPPSTYGSRRENERGTRAEDGRKDEDSRGRSRSQRPGDGYHYDKSLRKAEGGGGKEQAKRKPADRDGRDADRDDDDDMGTQSWQRDTRTRRNGDTDKPYPNGSAASSGGKGREPAHYQTGDRYDGSNGYGNPAGTGTPMPGRARGGKGEDGAQLPQGRKADLERKIETIAVALTEQSRVLREYQVQNNLVLELHDEVIKTQAWQYGKDWAGELRQMSKGKGGAKGGTHPWGPAYLGLWQTVVNCLFEQKRELEAMVNIFDEWGKQEQGNLLIQNGTKASTVEEWRILVVRAGTARGEIADMEETDKAYLAKLLAARDIHYEVYPEVLRMVEAWKFDKEGIPPVGRMQVFGSNKEPPRGAMFISVRFNHLHSKGAEWHRTALKGGALWGGFGVVWRNEWGAKSAAAKVVEEWARGRRD